MSLVLLQRFSELAVIDMKGSQFRDCRKLLCRARTLESDCRDWQPSFTNAIAIQKPVKRLEDPRLNTNRSSVRHYRAPN